MILVIEGQFSFRRNLLFVQDWALKHKADRRIFFCGLTSSFISKARSRKVHTKDHILLVWQSHESYCLSAAKVFLTCFKYYDLTVFTFRK